MKILALVFFFLSLTLPYVVLVDLKRWVLKLLGNDLSFRIQFVSPNLLCSIVVQIPYLVWRALALECLHLSGNKEH